MSTVEYGRHARRILEWDEVDIDDEHDITTTTQTDLSHGSVFQVEEEQPPKNNSLLASVSGFLKVKLKR